MTETPSFRTKIAYGVRTQGYGYLLRAPSNEMKNPRLSVTIKLRRALVAIGDALRFRTRRSRAPSDHLVVFYDLDCSPITYDFSAHLVAAEIERRARGLVGLFVVFVPGSYFGVRKELPDYENAIGPSERLYRLRHMLLPILALMPSVKGHCVCSTRAEASEFISDDPTVIYPSDYRPHLPRAPSKAVLFEHARRGRKIWPLLRATETALNHMREFIGAVAKNRKPIVITLRDNPTSAARNSDFDGWAAFLKRLDRDIYTPILVYDTETLFQRRPDHFQGEVFCDAASLNVELRMALYELAWLTLANMHGPIELCWYNEKVKYICFLEVGRSATSRAELITENGQRVGSDLEFATQYQRIVWEADTAASIEREFLAMAAFINRHGGSEPDQQVHQPAAAG